ncbi:hypothetical protein [Chryseobacterium sp.]|uniref:hypothetical protein n=1 Tax=Chryseobacterium sp. TaxID=1871047 RepID=UPI0012A95D9C|nr:hypothetical protein [Chryseobacterium sp.]QFG53409.1 hypothetical protein F7R58_07545 [Chryseobacterium sp.]
MREIEKLRERLEHYRNELENENYDAEQDVVDLELEVTEMMHQFDYQNDFNYKGKPTEFNALKAILQDIKKLKREFDFYDEQGERDMMFPNGDEEDFD